MFSGIVERVERIKKINSGGLQISLGGWHPGIGESLCVNGVCLTVSRVEGENFFFDISEETFERTNFKLLKAGDLINVERSLKVGQRISGHFVYGHVDATSKLRSVAKNKQYAVFEFENRNWKYLAEKGSVSLNGISLTLYELRPSSFKVSVVPHTFANTNLRAALPGDYFNVEFDILAKYAGRRSGKEISVEFLGENGFLPPDPER